MDFNDERDDLDDDVVARERAKVELVHIVQQAKRALQEGGIDLDLFFLVANSGSSILAFGTTGDPDDDLWARVGEIVSSIVGETVGLGRTRCREVICATTHDHQPSGSSVSRTPMPTPASQDFRSGEMR